MPIPHFKLAPVAQRGVVQDRATGRGLRGYQVTAYAAGRLGGPAAVLAAVFPLSSEPSDYRPPSTPSSNCGNRFGRLVHVTGPRPESPPGHLLTIEVAIRPERQRPEGSRCTTLNEKRQARKS